MIKLIILKEIINSNNHMLISLLCFILFTNSISSQDLTNGNIESEATITSIETNTTARRTYDTAKIWFTTTKGDTIVSQVQLNGIPFIGSFKSTGDTVAITYQQDNPYLVQTVSGSFLQQYAWHIIIGITLLYYGYKLVKRKKTAN